MEEKNFKSKYFKYKEKYLKLTQRRKAHLNLEGGSAFTLGSAGAGGGGGGAAAPENPYENPYENYTIHCPQCNGYTDRLPCQFCEYNIPAPQLEIPIESDPNLNDDSDGSDGSDGGFTPSTNHPMFRTIELLNQNNQRIIFEIEPIAAYYIENIRRYVVQYSFRRHYIENEKITECMINFYLSDGQTNCFNSESLFPFFAIDEGTGAGQKSNRVHVVQDRPGLLCKLNDPLKIVNATWHSEWIKSELERIYGRDRTTRFYANQYIQVQNIGVSSVLPRAADPVSLLLASSSEKLLAYQGRNGHFFAPNRDRPAWAPSDETSRGIQEDPRILDMYDTFRDKIATILIDYRICMCREIIEAQTHPIPFTPITLAAFNSLPGVALLDDNKNLIPDMEHNIQQYFEFVAEFSMCIGQYFATYIPAQVPGVQATTSQHFVNNFFNIFKFGSTGIHFRHNILQYLLARWGCELPT